MRYSVFLIHHFVHILSYDCHIMVPNMHRSLFLIRNCAYYMHNLINTCIYTGHIWMFYISNDCSTIGDIFCVFKLCKRSDRRVTTPNMHQSHSLIHCVCTASFKQENICRGAWNSTMLQMTPLLPRTILFVINVAKQSQSASYSPIHLLY